MTQQFQITANTVISGVCKAISTYYSGTLPIYKEREKVINTPAVSVYCINYEKKRERNDRYVNLFELIINYYPDNSPIIKNRRQEMYNEAEKICDAIEYIKLPAYKKSQGQLVEIQLPCKCGGIEINEIEQDFMQIATSYTVHTVKVDNIAKMLQLDLDIHEK